ncbi:MAG: FMN-binding protein [Desulfatibacillaceae bacterium]|nr:FMN-binding protein [Desulfatibacillaceae bacterium]
MKKRLFSIAYMFFLTLVCTGALAALEMGTRERVALNAQARLQGVILEVLALPVPANYSPRQISELFESRVRQASIDNRKVFVGLDKDGKTPIGFAFAATGPGFWGPIYCMVGIDADMENILGLNFYEHNETPGLGGRITELAFTEQFADMPLIGEGGIFFSFEGAGDKPGVREVDAITGATETSVRVEKFLNRELALFIETMRANRQKIVSAALSKGDDKP